MWDLLIFICFYNYSLKNISFGLPINAKRVFDSFYDPSTVSQKIEFEFDKLRFDGEFFNEY